MLTWLPILVSFAAFAVSVATLWMNYLSPFKLKTSFNAPTFSLYKITPSISGGKGVWWIPSFDVGFTFYNLGSRAGEVTDICIIAKQKSDKGQKEYVFHAKWLLDYPSYNRDGHDRMKWIDSSVVRDWYPLVIAGKSQQTVHVVLEDRRWDQKQSGLLDLSLQMFSSDTNKWIELAHYALPIREESFEDRSKQSVGDPKLWNLRREFLANRGTVDSKAVDSGSWTGHNTD